MSEAQVKVGIVGVGEVGRGWAALCVAAGWPVTLFDSDGVASNQATEDVAHRARNLVELGRATDESVEKGVRNMEVAGSLLQACREAQWIIESVGEDLQLKQKTFELIESASVRARAVTSSSSELSPTDIAARCKNKARVLVAHPMNPPELIPLVELVPSPATDTALVELVRGWLHALGRIAIVIKKPVPGGVVNRIAAAVWRECIDLVLNDIIDVDDLDRAVSLGPALGWAAAGPHLSYHLAAGDRGVRGFLQGLLTTFENSWESLATWSKLEPEEQKKIVARIEKAYADNVDVIRSARDRRLAAILRGLESARRE